MNKIPSAIFCCMLALFLYSCTKEKSIAVTSVSVSQATAEMFIGETIQLHATVLPGDATDKTVFWASSKQSVATVSSSGTVTAIAEGVSTITASSGGFFATCVVTVSKKVIPVSSVELDKTNLTLVKGTTEVLSATIKPNDATDPNVIWSSSNTAIASVDSGGRVTAVGGGEATIFAKAGEKEAKCIVTVTVPVASVKLNKEAITLIEGESEVLVAMIEPEDATDKTISWSTSNAQIAAVCDDGNVIAIKEGEATITAKAGDKSATCKVKVNAPYIPVSGIILNKTSLDIYQYDEEQLIATVYPSDATNKSINWSSSESGIASVDSNGKILGVSGGNATITVKTADGGFSAQCHVTVTADSHPAVDLGLSVKWAATNFGTSSQTETGGYYFYGDPTGTGIMMEYTAPDVSITSGTQYDIVRKNWGGKWRIPTGSELSELYTKCNWKLETVNGVSIFRVTGPNGNSILVPPSGVAYPVSGPIGTTALYAADCAYLMSGESYTDQYGRFVLVYYRAPEGSYKSEMYNVNLSKFTVRPVR